MLFTRWNAQQPVAMTEIFVRQTPLLSHCNWLLRIPTREEHGSMNLGQAVAVCLYELARGLTPLPQSKLSYETPPEASPSKRAKPLADAAAPAESGGL